MPSNSGNQNVKTFRNPSGYWEYEGAFSVELTHEADKSIVPAGVKIKGDTIYVSNGRIKQTIGGIQLRSLNQPFFWGYQFLKVIRDGKGNLIWVNYTYR